VDPHGLVLPAGRRDGALPELECSRCVDPFERGANVPVAVGEGTAATVCRLGRARKLDAVQRRDEVCDVGDRKRTGRQVALNPGVHGPEPRVPAAGPPARDRPWDRNRQLRGEERKPAELEVVLRFGAVAARDPHRELLAEPVDDVDRAVAGALERQVRPARELLGEERPDERLVDVELVGMDAHPKR
jgi:hypothetical protein